MPWDPSDQSELPFTASTMQALGLRGPGVSSELSGFDCALSLPDERIALRLFAHLAALCLAIAVLAGQVAPWDLLGWGVAALIAIIHCTARDRELASLRRPLVPRDRWRHALGLSGCATVWAVPLLLPLRVGSTTAHLSLWTLATILAAGLALTTRVTPLSTLLFAAITGLAAAAGFVIEGEGALALASLAFLAVALCGTIEGARSRLDAQIAQAGLADKSKVVSLLLREFEEHEGDWLWQIDTGRRVRGVSQRFAYALGQEPEALEGRSLLELAAGDAWSTDTCPPTLHKLADRLKQRQSFSDLLVEVDVAGRSRWWKLSGVPLTDEFGRFLGFRGVGSDVTARHMSAQRNAYLARHDALTGLPNRAAVSEALQEALGSGGEGACALMLIDLDRFKAVNDTLGHPVGDKLLVQVAARLRAVVEQKGLSGRLGGDEFAVVVPRRHVAEADALAGDIIQALSQPFEIDGHRLSIGASLGLAEAPKDGRQVEVLMRHADLALYRAKGSGRGVHHRYEPELLVAAHARRGLEVSMGEAVARQELALLFQPVVEATEERLIGFEALLRWNSPEHGLLEPERWIPLAEGANATLPIGDWVLGEACRQAARWPAPMKVAVNLAGAQLIDPALGDKVRQALSESGLVPERVELEVTEGCLSSDTAAVQAALRDLRQLGCRVALDDFGTGASSLSQLRRFRFSAVKIDRSFVRGAAWGKAAELATVRATVAMADSIGMGVTAEGVETGEEAALMRRLGCGRLQGFYYGRPMAAAEAVALACRRPPAEKGEQASLASKGRSVAA